EADGKGDGDRPKRPDQPAAELDEMLHQRSLGCLDCVLILVGHGASSCFLSRGFGVLLLAAVVLAGAVLAGVVLAGAVFFARGLGLGLGLGAGSAASATAAAGSAGAGIIRGLSTVPRGSDTSAWKSCMALRTSSISLSRTASSNWR